MERKRRHATREYIHTEEDEDIFLHSLDEITPEEIGEEAPKIKRTGGELVSFIIERGIYFFALAVFIVCVVELAITLGEQFVGDIYYDEMMDKFSVSHLLTDDNSHTVTAMRAVSSSEPFIAGVSQPDPGITIEKAEYDETVELLKASMASLSRQYPDVYAWIYIEDTIIDYPVVRGDDNEFYLNHAFTGEPLSYGSIFADYTLKDNILDNYNIVFYGHNSSTGKMFAELMKFANSEEFFMTHNIYVYTTTGLYVFEPFNLSMFSYDYQYFRTYFTGPEDFLSFVDEMKADPIYGKDLEFDENDHILTLSTCTKTGISTLRYCLQSKLIEIR